MAVKHPSTCIHCGPCERYARNNVCVTCAARRAAEKKEKQKQVRELGATAEDITAGTLCKVCGEPWRYTMSRKCVTCAEASGTRPKERKPKREPVLKGGHRGKRPNSAYSLIARATIDEKKWELWERWSSHPDWRPLKLRCVGRHPKKANFWLSWSRPEQRFARHKTIPIMTEHFPLLHAFVVAVMQDADIETLFNGQRIEQEDFSDVLGTV